jgi:hypothetical protein
MRRLLAKKGADGTNVGKALVFAVNANHPGVILPELLKASKSNSHAFILQHKFADIEVGESSFSVKLAFQGEWKDIVIPYAALIDFFEMAAAQATKEGPAFSSVDIPANADAIRKALAIKAEVGASDTLAIQMRFRIESAKFEPDAGLEGHFELVIDHNYWDLIIEDDRFAVTVLDNLTRRRVTVPFGSIEEISGFSSLGETRLNRLGGEITAAEKEETAEVDDSLQSKALVQFATSYKPSLALAALLTSIVWAIVSSVLIFLASREQRVSPEQIAFFSYLSPNFLAALKAGHVPVAGLFSDKSLLGGLGALWSAGTAVTGISLLLPMHDDKPMHMQAGIKGFFYAYVLTLLIYGGLTISYRYVPGLLRLSWIILLYAVGERLKRAYPPKRVGSEYFPQVIDGLFAISASFIIAQGIDKAYDQALSGPVFVLIYFAIMLLFGRRMVRALLLRQLSKGFSLASEIELPEQDGQNWSQRANAASGILGQIRRKRDRLVLLSFEELLAEYKQRFHGKERKMIVDSTIRDASPPFVAACFALMLAWSVGVLFAVWAATNFDLYIFGVGR